MNQKLTKESVKKYMEIKGEVRGLVLKIDADYILKEKGEPGLKMVEKKLEELGCPIKYKKIKGMSFYPLGWRVITLLVIKEVFNFNEEKIKEMGEHAPKTSLIVKLLIRYFTLPQKVFMREAPRGWRKHYTVGELVPVEFSKEKKCFIVRIKDFALHPLVCHYVGGSFLTAVKMLVKTPKATLKETKCTFKGDKFHEFQVTWQ